MIAGYFALDHACVNCGHSLLFDHRYHLVETVQRRKSVIVYKQVTDGCQEGCPCIRPLAEPES